MNDEELFINYYAACLHYVYTSANNFPTEQPFITLMQTSGYDIKVVFWSRPFDLDEPSRDVLSKYTIDEVQNTYTMYKKNVTTPQLSVKTDDFIGKDFCYFKNGERISIKIQGYTSEKGNILEKVEIGTIPHIPEEAVEFPIIVIDDKEVATIGVLVISNKGEIIIFGDLNKSRDTLFRGWKTIHVTYFLC